MWALFDGRSIKKPNFWKICEKNRLEVRFLLYKSMEFLNINGIKSSVIHQKSIQNYMLCIITGHIF